MPIKTFYIKFVDSYKHDENVLCPKSFVVQARNFNTLSNRIKKKLNIPNYVLIDIIYFKMQTPVKISNENFNQFDRTINAHVTFTSKGIPLSVISLLLKYLTLFDIHINVNTIRHFHNHWT